MRHSLLITIVLLTVLTVLAGCASYDRPHHSAQTLAKGKEQEMVVTVPADGRLYVEQVKKNETVWNKRVARGDKVVLNPAKRVLTLNGRRIDDVKIEYATYMILFEPGASSAPPAQPAVASTPPAPKAPAAAPAPAADSRSRVTIPFEWATNGWHVTATPSGVVRAEPQQSKSMLVNVSVNGSSPHKFLLDTGCETTTLAAGDYSGPLDASPTTSAPGGQAQAKAGQATVSLTMGALNEPQMHVAVASLPPELRQAGIMGVLGVDFLQNYRYTIDSQSQTVTLERFARK